MVSLSPTEFESLVDQALTSADPTLAGAYQRAKSEGVEVLARPHQFAQAEQITAAHAASVISALQEYYDFVVLDGPMRFDSGGRTVLEMSDIRIQFLDTEIDPFPAHGVHLVCFSIILCGMSQIRLSKGDYQEVFGTASCQD